MQVQYGSVAMIQPWMALVEEIRGNFPGLETPQALEEHRQTVLRFMEKRQALCVRDGGRVAGVLLFSRGRNMICCLGVSPAYQAAGDCLPAPGGGPGAAGPHPGGHRVHLPGAGPQRRRTPGAVPEVRLSGRPPHPGIWLSQPGDGAAPGGVIFHALTWPGGWLIVEKNSCLGGHVNMIERFDINEAWAHSGIIKAGDFCCLNYCVGNVGGTNVLKHRGGNHHGKEAC